MNNNTRSLSLVTKRHPIRFRMMEGNYPMPSLGLAKFVEYVSLRKASKLSGKPVSALREEWYYTFSGVLGVQMPLKYRKVSLTIEEKVGRQLAKIARDKGVTPSRLIAEWTAKEAVA